jgi:RNA polymerase sigma-70 factor (ECF subfamily)
MSEEEQRAWVEAAQQGDERAFADIFYHYQVSLFNLARHLVGDPDEAEDVVQKAFVKAFRSLSRIRRPTSLESWLRTIVYTTSIDHLRRRKRKRELPLDDRLRQPTVPFPGPEQEALLQERIDLVQRALQEMPPRYRTYILLREFEGLSYDQMVETLGEPITTVRVALFRARKLLRELLRQMAGEEEE